MTAAKSTRREGKSAFSLPVHYRHLPAWAAVLQVLLDEGSEVPASELYKRLPEVMGREISRPALYSSLLKLEESGLITSKSSAPIKKRGGRTRKLYLLEGAGADVLREYQTGVHEVASNLESWVT